MIFDFCTPSDAITFETPVDGPAGLGIAFVVGMFIGRGKAVVNALDGTSVPCTHIFGIDDKAFADLSTSFLGTTLDEFAPENTEAIVATLKSFAYGKLSDRPAYNEAHAAAAAEGAAALEKFRQEHEDSKRTSASRWVQHAWDMGKQVSDDMMLPVRAGQHVGKFWIRHGQNDRFTLGSKTERWAVVALEGDSRWVFKTFDPAFPVEGHEATSEAAIAAAERAMA